MAIDEVRRPGRRVWWVAGAAVVAVAVAAVVLLRSDRGDDVGRDPGTPTTTSSPSTAPGSSTTTSTRAGGGEPSQPAIWPLATATSPHDDPSDAARTFAVEYLRFREPIVGAFRAGDSRSGEVPIRARRTGPVTTVLVRQLGGEEAWSVIGATTPNIDVGSPSAGDEVGSPVRVDGRAHAFEGTVSVEVRSDDGVEPIGAGFVTGGGDQMRPFTGTIDFDAPGATGGVIVFFTQSAENGEVWEAAVVPVVLRPTAAERRCGGDATAKPEPADDEMVVTAFFSCGETSLAAAPRAVLRSPGVLRASLEALLAGPDDHERATGITSFFSADTAGALRGVTIDDGHAIVDLDDLRSRIPNASSSAGSAVLLAQLDATVFQFGSVETAEYRLEGRCEAFTEWVQLGGCDPRRRPGRGR